MENNDVVANVSGSASAAGASKDKRESLHTRLYFKAHLTEIARAFRYDCVPLDEARDRLAKLSHSYGQTLIADGAEELIEIRSTAAGEVACLKDNVRKIAAALLGKPPADAVPRINRTSSDGPTEITDPLSDDIAGEMDLRDDEPGDDAHVSSCESMRNTENSLTKPISNLAPCIRLTPHNSADAQGKPVRLPRKQVLVHFQEWLREAKQPFVAVDAAKHRKFADGKLSTLDFILYEEPLNKLVTVRQKLSARERTVGHSSRICKRTGIPVRIRRTATSCKPLRFHAMERQSGCRPKIADG